MLSVALECGWDAKHSITDILASQCLVLASDSLYISTLFEEAFLLWKYKGQVSYLESFNSHVDSMNCSFL